MTLREVTEEVIYLEEVDKGLDSLQDARVVFDGWIHFRIDAKYVRWWYEFPLGAPYQVQVEALKIKGVI